MDMTHDALINIAAVSVKDRDTMTNQRKIISDLTATVAALNQQLQQANTNV